MNTLHCPLMKQTNCKYLSSGTCRFPWSPSKGKESEDGSVEYWIFFLIQQKVETKG